MSAINNAVSSAQSPSQNQGNYEVLAATKQKNIQQLEGQDAAALITSAAALPPRATGQTGSVVNVVA